MNKLPTLDDLRELARRDIIVREFLKLWDAGHFPSLESCLIAAVDYFARLKRRSDEAEVARIMADPGPIVVTRGV